MRLLWLVVFAAVIFYFLNNKESYTSPNDGPALLKEGFVSGEEKLMNRYDEIYPLDHPKYTTPQQKDFQIVLSEHSALDPNMQLRRKDIATQLCKAGEKCFDTQEFHTITSYGQFKSLPDIINTKIDPEPGELPGAIYDRYEHNKIVPANSTSLEMRADLFDDIILPDLFFRRKVIKETF